MGILRHRLLAAGAGLLLACALTPVASRAMQTASPTPSEYQVKAVFLFNFAQFVDWPEDAFAATDAPLVIGVLGADPFGAELDDVVRGERVRGREFVVKRYRTVEDIKPSHILFVSRAELERFGSALPRLEKHAVLTVSDAEQAAQRGVVIQFVSERNRIRLRINVDAAKAAGLTISSKLLRPADIVGSRGG